MTATLYANSSQGVILCPPHPLYGGTRNDTRIVRVARELASSGISALCIDYGNYGKGIEEIQNVLDAVSFMGKKVDCLGLLGYSFGAIVASNVARQTEIDGFVAMSILKRINSIDAISDFACPKLFIHGKRDNIAPYSDFKQLYKEANERKEKLVLDTDHFYMEDYPTIIDLASKRICKFFAKIFSR
ncbi:MAG: dienelactone hydrolase family protein [Candidatus Bathyarchaeota archaeon]|nr:MAG: dienelactone hydrolase family protein [Candidatus Bathyarchaeota archaeon]